MSESPPVVPEESKPHAEPAIRVHFSLRDFSFRKIPWATVLCCLTCVGIFAGIHLTNSADTNEGIEKWGAASGFQVWQDGQWWTLISSALVHLHPLHLILNVYWLWILGSPLERAFGFVRWVVLFAVCAFVSSVAQLAYGGDAGIGGSGVVYAFFGLMWLTRNCYPSFWRVAHNGIVQMFVLWLFVCMFIPFIGNAAHAGGLIFGAAIGAAIRWKGTLRAIACTGIALLIALSVAVLFWCPWSWAWNSAKAQNAYVAGDYRSAIVYWERASELDADPQWVLTNLSYAYQMAGDLPKAKDAAARAAAAQAVSP
jgi:rhomboid protease GluP